MKSSTHFRALLLAGASLALCAAAHSTRAAEAAATASEPAATTVEEVTITARKKQERLVDVPVSANALSGAALDRSGITDMTQMGLLVPQVSIDKAPSGNGAIITIRGIGSPSIDGSIEQEVTVNIDGVPTSRGRVLYSSNFDESSVEVLKGPQALYFGKNSPAGVISLNSVNPGHEFEGYVRAGVEAETETYFGEGAVTLPINNDLSARIAFRGSQMINGYITDVGGPITNPAQLPLLLAIPTSKGIPGYTLPGTPYKNIPAETDEAARLTLLYKPAGRFDANFKFLIDNHEDRGAGGTIIDISCHGSHPGSTDLVGRQYLTDPYGVCGRTTYNSVGTLPTAISALYPGSHNGIPYSETVSILSSLSMNYRLTDQLLLTSVTGFFKTRSTGFSILDGTDLAIAAGENNEFNTSVTQEVRASSSFQGPLNFTAGALYEHDQRHFIQNGFIGYFSDGPGQTNTFGSRQYFNGDTYSAFAEVNWKILPKVEIAFGARETEEEKTGDLVPTFSPIKTLTAPVGVPITGKIVEHNISPQVTVSYHLARDIMFYGAYKQGFKSGGFSSPSVISPTFTAQNQEYGQETVEGGEIGLKFSNLYGRFTGDVTLYDYSYTGLQLTAFEPPANFFTQNAGSATSKGIEVNLAAQVTRELILHGSFGYNNAQFTSFPGAQCWTMQSVAEGCVNGVQNLTGHVLDRAPDVTATMGFAYDVPVTQDWKLGLTVDGRYSDSYYTNPNDNPFGKQSAFMTLDSSLRFYDKAWEFSVIGRNLTDTIYAVLSSDKPLGIRGDVFGTIGRPREVILQVTRHF